MDFATSQASFAAALADPAMPLPAGVTSARGEPDAARFAVYRNNVAVGLIKALEAKFPTVLRLVGDEFFRGMAGVYCSGHKPKTPLIFEYGADFPDFVDRFEPARSVAYLGDVARLEAAWLYSYHAADAFPLAIKDLAQVPAERLGHLKLTPHPAAAIVSSAFPIGSIWVANRENEVRPVRAWHAETVLITRPDVEVGVHVLPGCDATFAADLLRGEPLGAAAESAASASAEFDFGAALVGLVSLGAFGAMHFEGEDR